MANHELPFGGVGLSGQGSYHGKATFDAFTHQKSVLVKRFLGDAPQRYPPYSGKFQRALLYVLQFPYAKAHSRIIRLALYAVLFLLARKVGALDAVRGVFRAILQIGLRFI